MTIDDFVRLARVRGDYPELHAQGLEVGRDARRLMEHSELDTVRKVITQIAAEIEAMGDAAAFARGFLKATDRSGVYGWSD